MYRASSCPLSGTTTTAEAASSLPSELGDGSAAGRGRAGRPEHDQQHCYHHVPTINQRLLLQLLQLLMMGMRMPETCWAVFKWQVVNLRICCIWLVDSVESMIMQGLANPKSYVHLQEDYIVQEALHGMVFMHLCKHSSRLQEHV